MESNDRNEMVNNNSLIFNDASVARVSYQVCCRTMQSRSNRSSSATEPYRRGQSPAPAADAQEDGEVPVLREVSATEVAAAWIVNHDPQRQWTVDERARRAGGGRSREVSPVEVVVQGAMAAYADAGRHEAVLTAIAADIRRRRAMLRGGDTEL